MATITDIAKEAGVAVGTASRVLNRHGGVSPAKAEAVEKAVKKLGYDHRPIRPGRRKINNGEVLKTGTVLFLSVFGSSPERLYRIPAFPLMLGGIQNALKKNGLDLVLAHSPDGQEVPPVLARKQVDGALLFGSENMGKTLKKALSQVPVVWCSGGEDDVHRQYDHVLYDNFSVGRMAADYLIDAGHQKLAFINAYSKHSAYRMRCEQFVRRARDREATVEIIELSKNPSSNEIVSTVRDLTSRLIATVPFPTGVFCPSDNFMLLVYNTLHKFGLEPGEDIELIGCNNDPVYMEQMHPRPATIDIKLDAVGERAVEELLRRMTKQLDDNRTDIVVAPKLIPAEAVDNRKPEVGERSPGVDGQRSENPFEEIAEPAYV